MTESGKNNSTRISPAKGAAVVAAVVLLFFACAEILLRFAGFQFDTRPRYMEFNFPNPHELHEIFEPDPVTLWRLRPGVSMGEGIEPISREGFRGPDFTAQKPEGVKRVIALGDSVTFGAQTSYPAELQKCLGDGYEVINAGVPGYSSLQGQRLFKSRLAELKPDVVIVMFGWNDHWLAHGYSDAQQTMNPPRAGDHGAVENLRIYQLVHWILSRFEEGDKSGAGHTMRVSLKEYRNNIEDIVTSARGAGARVVLVTAPSALDLGRVPRFLYDLRFIEGSPDEPQDEAAKKLEKLHESYNDVVRSIAESTDSTLVDIDRKWNKRGVSDLFRDPDKDIVHPDPEGYRLIAETLCDSLGGEE